MILMEVKVMVEKVSVILHWNTDYAEIPRKELPRVVELSYQPMVNAIENWNDGTICFNITGHTIEYIQKNNPELIDQIKNLVKNKTVEMLASGYSHPILPLLPRERVETQLKDHIEQIKKIFGEKSKGIWPPELAVSPSVLSQIKKQGIEWTAVDYEHFLLSQHFGNDRNPFERRNLTVTELLVEAYWAHGVNQLKAYLKASKIIRKANLDHNNPLQRVTIDHDHSIKAYLSSVSWANSTQFAVGGHVPLYNEKKHLKLLLQTKAKMLPLYSSDIEFFGYRSMGPEPAAPEKLTSFLETIKKQIGIQIISPTQVPEEEWPKEPSYLSSGSWSDDKSFRIWTDSEDNKEYTRRAEEIYGKLSKKNWEKKIMLKIEPYLRIFENSDPRGWAPIPERKNEAYSAMIKIFEILEKED
ncbi:MAG: hypothetical protein EAX90_08660 [Candidatus Heimdallarchaeota archaeon]|nr:hypothetical protein [Candidatus Heimdallarchaeota archaeon]